MIKAVLAEPGRKAKVTEIENTLENLQKIVGDYTFSEKKIAIRILLRFFNHTFLLDKYRFFVNIPGKSG